MNAVRRVPPCEMDSLFLIFGCQQNHHKYTPVHDTTLTLLFQVYNIYVYRSSIQFINQQKDEIPENLYVMLQVIDQTRIKEHFNMSIHDIHELILEDGTCVI